MQQNIIKFPKKVIITVGKAGAKREIHIGHLAGGMIEADIYARFLRTQIGKENVLLFSGAECYGSSMIQSFEKNRDRFDNIEDYIHHMYSLQKQGIENFQIEFDDYFCITDNERLQKLHTLLCQRFIDAMQSQGILESVDEEILVDPATNRFLNYKQVETVDSNSSIDSGLKYDTADAEQLVSKISGSKPEIKTTTNYFMNLQSLREKLIALHKDRYPYLSKYTAEYLTDPLITVPNKYLEQGKLIGEKYNAECREGKRSFSLSIASIESYRKMINELRAQGIEFSSEKVLDKCRITGNSEWGIKVPIDDEEKNVWVWIDSMLEPISFTMEHMMNTGKDIGEWQKWWCEDGAQVCHFMAQDNIFFYTMVENALLLSWNESCTPKFNYPEFHLTPMRILFNGKYNGPFPTADILLQKYTPEQIRYSIATMGKRNSSFNPEKLMNDDLQEDNITNRANSFIRRLKRFSINAAEQVQNSKEDSFDASEQAVKTGTALYNTYISEMANRNFSAVINMIEEKAKGLLKDKENSAYYAKLILVMTNPFFPEFTEGIYKKLYPDDDIAYGYNPNNKTIKVNQPKKEQEIDI